MANHQSKKLSALTLVAVTLIFTIVSSWLNWHASTLGLCGVETGLPLAVGFPCAWLFGVFGGVALMIANDKTGLNQQKKVEWQAQDAKLMASLASDREKQLAAKITTLEAALKTALKKRDQVG